jgi:hypothetical protein
MKCYCPCAHVLIHFCLDLISSKNDKLLIYIIPLVFDRVAPDLPWLPRFHGYSKLRVTRDSGASVSVVTPDLPYSWVCMWRHDAGFRGVASPSAWLVRAFL